MNKTIDLTDIKKIHQCLRVTAMILLAKFSV